ncbi:MAG: tRNA (adenosine(37)-N6)-threonylcarbamoyltransferase complex dimerization subunit type 1 TsaB [Candidatus Omnitrophica bacterium]|nr:tRNA (adenosine(37)-N6)-threonylcarbamoyltransferase complex dimerization subunit type 1 TsaB [Candidatus Omnitrophota bacterium]
MKILAIDTSTNVLGVAVLDESGKSVEFNDDRGLRHTSHLIPTVKKALKRARLKLRDLDAFCVSRGPGSFTGLRIGIATVKALGLAAKKKVVAVPSLDVLAQNIPYTKDTICVIGDAKKEKLYACFYKYSDHRPTRFSPYLLISYEELFKRLRKIKNDILLVGDGIKVIRSMVPSGGFALRGPGSIEFTDEKYWYPRALNTAKIGLEMFKNGQTVKDLDSLVPLYLHPRDVQCRKK